MTGEGVSTPDDFPVFLLGLLIRENPRSSAFKILILLQSDSVDGAAESSLILTRMKEDGRG